MTQKKVAFVTGGAQGIGEATVRRLSADGFAVAIADLNLDGAQKLTDELNANGGTAIALKLDVSDKDAFETAVDEAAEKLGDFNVIVNNAGLAPTTPVGTVTPEQFDKLM
ncbi:MAG: SDR family NAD(P)-dependent oxidoreductase, partial [Streptococcus gallolyticus]|nr:SDR family NAD(P)-dependent oxidoreductase [Streptococcus gallolyticus]